MPGKKSMRFRAMVSMLVAVDLLVQVSKGDDFECELSPRHPLMTIFHNVSPEYVWMNYLVPSNLESRYFANPEKPSIWSLINPDGNICSEHLIPTVSESGSPKASSEDVLFQRLGGVPGLVYGRNHFFGKLIGINQVRNQFYLSDKSRLPFDQSVKTIPLDTKFGDLRCQVKINGQEMLAKIEFDLEQSLAMHPAQFQRMFPDESKSDGVCKLKRINFFDSEISDVAIQLKDDPFAPVSIGFDLVRRMQSEFLFEQEQSRWQFVPTPAYVMPNRFRFDFDSSMTRRGLRIDAVHSWGIAVNQLETGDIVVKINGVPVRRSLICILQERIAEVLLTGGQLDLIRDRYPKRIEIKPASDQ
jgi:hypothetical protein